MEGNSTVSRLTPLDTLRGVAALSVLTWHYRTNFHVMPLASVLAPVYQSGGYAVVFFFVLSGYVLSHVYFREQRRLDFWGNMRARLARMGPLHYATLLLVAGAQLAFWKIEGRYFSYVQNDAHDFFLNLVFLQQSGLQHALSFNGPSWSISAELIVNVVFLALIVSGRRLALAGFAALSLAALAVLVSSPTYGWSGGDLLYSVHVPADPYLLVAFSTFFFGAILYRVLPPSLRPSHVYDFIFALALLATLAMMANRDGELWAHFDLILSFVTFPAMIVCGVLGPLTSRVLSGIAGRWLGSISFSLYLMHFPVHCIFHAIDLGIGIPFDSPLVFAAVTATSLFVATVTTRYFERPMYRRLWSRRSLVETQGVRETGTPEGCDVGGVAVVPVNRV